LYKILCIAWILVGIWVEYNIFQVSVIDICSSFGNCVAL
jgi:hypothetical protein